MSTFELELFIRETLTGYAEKAAARGIRLQVVDDLVSFITLTGEESKLRELLHSVMTNAVENSGATQISFSTQQLLRAGSGILIEFVLRHNGLAVSGPRPFRYYRQMIAAKELVEALNGKSETLVSSGGHTTQKFIIKCTLRDGEAPELPQRRCACALDLEGRHVLVAEDNELNQRAISRILEGEGLRVTITGNGKEAIDRLEAHNDIDAVLLDLQMPYMDGLQTAAYIRKVLQLSVPILGISAGNDPEQAARCEAVGMNGFIQKPFRPEALVTRLCEAMAAPVASVG